MPVIITMLPCKPVTMNLQRYTISFTVYCIIVISWWFKVRSKHAYNHFYIISTDYMRTGSTASYRGIYRHITTMGEGNITTIEIATTTKRND